MISRMTLFAAVAVPLSALSSCVNEAYDLNKGIDTTVNVDGNISMPVGSTGKILIGDFLEIDGNSGLVTDELGDYSLKISGTPVTESVSLPPVTFPSGDFLEDFDIQPLSLKSTITEAVPDFGDYQDQIDSYPLSGMAPVTMDGLLGSETVTSAMDINQDVSELAATVSEIGTIYLDAAIKLSFLFDTGNGQGKITVKKGLQISFPEFIAVGDIPDIFSSSDSHVLTLNEDISLLSGTPLELGFSLKEMDLEMLKTLTGGAEGYIEENGKRYLRIRQSVEVGHLVLEILPEDFGKTLGDVPETIGFDMGITSGNAVVTGATLVFDPAIDLEDQIIEIGQMPEFLSGENVNLDVYNPVITLKVTNSTPAAVAVSAKLQGYDSNGDPVMDNPIEIGTESEPIIIRNLPEGKECLTTVYISRRPIELDPVLPADQYALNLVIDNLSGIIASMPEKIAIYDISVVPYHEDGSKYTAVSFSSSENPSYEFGVDYDVNVPLAFGEDLLMKYPYDITGLNSTFNSDTDEAGNVSIHVDRAEIKMTFVNTLPMDMAVEALPIDIDGNVIPSSAGIEVSMSSDGSGQAHVSAGTLESPADTPVTISLSAKKDAVKSLDGFRLEITGTSSAATAGIPLNSNQYIQITGMSINFDGGIETEL